MCCLFGIIDPGHSLPMKLKNRLLSALATAAEARGTDATGIAYNYGGLVHIYKRPLAGHQIQFKVPGDVSVIMGHTRMTTQGVPEKNRNNHPFLGRICGHEFAFAHNGVIYNDDILRRTMSLPRTRIETDSYVGVQILEQQKALDHVSLKFMAEQLRGPFTITVLSERDDLYFVKGDNPLCLYFYPKTGLYVYASTETILSAALSRVKLWAGNHESIPVEEGSILQICRDGSREWSEFDSCFGYSFHRPMFRFDPYDAWKRAWSSPENTYLDELKAVAAAFGYAPDAIDRLSAQGFTPEEIEEFLYESEGYSYDSVGH